MCRPLWAAFWAAALCCVLWPAMAAPAADVASGYQAAVRDFAKLRQDPASGGRRDLWKELDARFAALAKAAGKAPLGAKILYYQAWTEAELGARSYLEADFAAAAALYKRMAEAYPKHAWADDALLRRADLLKGPLKKPDEAKADLELLLKRHAKGDMAARAKAMLAELGGAAAPEPAPAKAATTAAEAPAAKPKAAAPGRKAGPAPATAARPAVLTKAQVAGSANGGQLTLNLSRETTYRYQLLEQKRTNGETAKLLYLDLDNTRTGQGIASEKRYAKGAVSRLRAGYFTPETVRVVLELADVRQYEIRSENDPFRIVVDLTGGEAGKAGEYRAQAAKRDETPAAPAKKGGEPAAATGQTKPGPTASARADGEKPSLVPPADARKRAGSLIEQLGLSVRTIMIDPGHGGKDPGAQGLHGLTEKDVNLRFAQMLGELLRKKGFNVLYTRTTDVFIPLETRTEMANTKGADLFVSVHCNSHGNPESQGLETYSLNLANSRDAVRVAARENAVSQKKVSDLQAILTDLMLSAKTAESKDLARLVQKRSLSGLRGAWRTRDRGPHEAPFFVLIGANMPAVLVELGYITNADEAKRLTADAYLRDLAQGMADGIVAYKKRIERYANL
ncbi:MAG: N-acetylmuramoyl-L-alanine amidase [Solidesulfovibrio sp. DCME]|uniref:N-acetylmuramoyl-L-alanine amidase n=1 Tax=Solidesulfovibrio sp. DCME TaxID=3447380 RepID=UPI003D145B46